MPRARVTAPVRVAVLAIVAALAAALALTACANPAAGRAGPRSSRQAGGHRPGEARLAGPGLAAVRAGLTSRAGGGPAYYLALGDSLSVGLQPTAAGADAPTSHGYPDRLAARLRRAVPGLRLVKLGCSGETTTTMIRGGICRYPAGSQLAQAAAFLRAHRGRTALITLDIGANDVNSCVLGKPAPTILTCLLGRIGTTMSNLGSILARLRQAGGRRVLIVGMTYYVPELGLWRDGRNGQRIAVATDDFVAGANRMLATRYRRYGARVADVFGAFRSADFGGALAHAGRRVRALRADPPNVSQVCALTWMCARPPRGPDEHANNAGYLLIARTFWRAVAGPPQGAG